MFGEISMFYIFQSSHGKVTHTHDFFHGRPIDTAIWFNEHGINCNSPIGEILGFGGYFDGEHWFYDVGDSFTFRRYIKEHFGDENMTSQIIKLTKERDELKGKIIRLKKFMKSDQFKELDQIDRMLLKTQKHQMKALLKTIEIRANWKFNDKYYEKN